MSKASLSIIHRAPLPCLPPQPPTPPRHLGWKDMKNNNTVPGRVETDELAEKTQILTKREKRKEQPPLQSCFQYAVINAVLLRKYTNTCKHDLFSLLYFFFFVYYMFENEIIKLPTWTKCAIFWSFYNMYNAQCLFLYCLLFFLFCFVFVFLDQHYKPWPAPTSPTHHTSHGICAFFLLQDNFKGKKWRRKKNGKKNKQKENSLLQVVQLSVLAVQAAAGGHLSKYITVIWIKTTEHMK